MNEQFFYRRPLFGAQLNMAHPLTRGLVGCWVLNENSPNSMRAWDSSPYGQHGTVTGALGRWQGRTFDGDDYINGTNNSALDFTTGAFSILMWIKPTGVATEQRLFIRGEHAVAGYEMSVASNGGFYLDTEQSAAAQRTTAAANTLTADTWVLLTGTRSGATVKLYKNAGEVSYGVQDTHINPVTSTNTFKIGIYEDLALSPFSGTVGEVLVYNRALSVVEIQQLYLAPYAMFLR